MQLTGAGGAKGAADAAASAPLLALQSPGALQTGAPLQHVQHTLHELEPLTNYAIRVLAVNALGRSRASAPILVRTEEEGKCRAGGPEPERGRMCGWRDGCEHN